MRGRKATYHFIHQKLCISILLLFSFLVVQAQNHILDQWVFSSETDSMQLRDYVDQNKNYVISMYGDWCYPCKQELRAWKESYAEWQQEYNLEIIVLDDFNGENIVEALDTLNIEYDYTSFVTKDIHSSLDVQSFPTNLFITGNSLVYMSSGAKEVEEMEQLFSEVFTKQKFPILDAPIEQKQLLLENCAVDYGAINSEVGDTILLNGFWYRELYSEELDERFFLRESDDLNYVFIYDEEKEEEFVLFDYTKGVCEEIELYSPLLKQMISTQVVNVYCIGQRTYYETNIPYTECFGEDVYYTLVTGIGSDAGIIPVFDQAVCYSNVICQFEEEELTYQNPESENCEIVSDVQETPLYAEGHVFPNPNTGEFAVEHKKEITAVIVYDVSGRKVHRETVQAKSKMIDLGELASGAYFLTMELKEGIEMYKVVVLD